MKLILKSLRFVQFGVNLTQFECHICHPWFGELAVVSQVSSKVDDYVHLLVCSRRVCPLHPMLSEMCSTSPVNTWDAAGEIINFYCSAHLVRG